MSIEDLRDDYKNLRQSNDHRLKLNGATYRKLRHELSSVHYGNLIRVNQEGVYRGEMDEINSKYDLDIVNSNRDFAFSLNKKKRWELPKSLGDEMQDLAENGVDVRLYETRNRNEKKGNCIAVHKTKGQQIEVKKTYANLNSIKKTQELESMAKTTKSNNTVENLKRPHVAKKNRKCSKPGLNQGKTKDQNELIVIDVDQSDDEDVSYIQYQIEYAPTSDVLKYGARKLAREGNFAKSTRMAKFFQSNLNEEAIPSDTDEEVVDNTGQDIVEEGSKSEGLEVDLDDLLVRMVEKSSLSEANKSKAGKGEANEVHNWKDRKIYIEKQELDSSDSGSEWENKPNFRISAKPIDIELDVYNHGLDADDLKATYGLKYAEARFCWPRMFAINLEEELRTRLLRKFSTNKDFDVVFWLRLEQTSKPAQSYDASRFNVSILANLNCESIGLENVNPFQVFSLECVIEKAIEFMLNLPLDFYRRKDFSKPWTSSNTNHIVDQLPNICGGKCVKTIEQLKLELVQDSGPENRTSTPQLERLNSIEVVKKDEIVDELEEKKVSDRLANIFSEKSFECMLCFDQKTDLDDCVVIKSCAHCFCRSCMREYVDSLLFQTHLKAGSFQCPGCNTNLELALLINHASDAQLAEIFIRKTIERVVFVLNDYKWCPSPFCGKILQVDLNSNPFGTVSCSCGFKMCLRCNNPPHFPAKCSQVANYYKELQINNDFFEPDDEVCTSVGKRCPLCSTYIEKNGGCNHMFCSACKRYFCWNCLVDWNSHGTQCRPVKFGEVRVEFKKERKAGKTKSNQVRYEDSLTHRQKRTHKSKQALKADIKRLIGSINFESQDPAVDKKDEIKKYLVSMVDFLNELHFVCEHAYVLISDKSLSREKVNRIRNLIVSIEISISLIEMIYKSGCGFKVLDELKRHEEKSLRCIKLLNKIKEEF